MGFSYRNTEVSAERPPKRSFAARWGSRFPTYLADTRENPAFLLMFIFARFVLIRWALWPRVTKAPAKTKSSTLFPGIDRAAMVARLRAKGLCFGLLLPFMVTEEIVRFARETPCFGNLDRRVEFMPDDHVEASQRFGRMILTGHYFERVSECDAVRKIERDPALLDIARSYLGRSARVCATRLWWSFPSRGASEADLSVSSQDKFHFDLDDWRMVKFFFYLTDVDDTTGPHVYVEGSHARRLFKHEATLVVGHPTEELVAAYGGNSFVALKGPAGFGFGEDPFGFHLGRVVERSPRLICEIAFGVSKPSRRRFYGEPVFS